MPKKRNNPDVILPVVDCNITQKESFIIAEKAGLLSPAYVKGITRLGCWFCHNQRLDELRRLRCNYPELWQRLLDIDLDSPYTFKSDATIHDLDKRFVAEFWRCNREWQNKVLS